MLDRLIDVLLQIVGYFQFWFVLPQNHVAVRLRLGAYWDTPEPGRIHFKAPFGIDQILSDNGVTTCYDMQEQALTLRCGTTIICKPVITTRVHSPETYFLEVESPETALSDAAAGTLRSVLSGMDYAGACSDDVTELLTKAVRKTAWKWGIEVIAVQLSDLAKVRAYRIYGSER